MALPPTNSSLEKYSQIQEGVKIPRSQIILQMSSTLFGDNMSEV